MRVRLRAVEFIASEATVERPSFCLLADLKLMACYDDDGADGGEQGRLLA